MKENALIVPSFDSNLSRYLQEIQKFPMLTQKEEYKLAKLWKDSSDLKAAHKLITSHLRLVTKIALKFRNYGVPLVDLISEGNIGLMKAIKKFDPEMGFRLSTYALWWIKATIQDYIIRTWSILKIGSAEAQKKLFYSFNKVKNKLLSFTDKAEKSDNAKNVNALTPVISLNQTLNNDNHIELQDTIPDVTQNPEDLTIEKQNAEHRSYFLKSALLDLTEREKDIIIQRKLQEKPVTLDILSKKYSISSERVRQIEEKSMRKLKSSIEKHTSMYSQ